MPVLLFPCFPLLLAFQTNFSGAKLGNTASLKSSPSSWRASLLPALASRASRTRRSDLSRPLIETLIKHPEAHTDERKATK